MSRFASGSVLLLWALASSPACESEPDDPVSECLDETTQACSCEGGAAGVSTCNSGVWSACACDGTPLCTDGETQSCACENGSTGTQTCSAASWGACEGCSTGALCTDFATGSTAIEGDAFYEPCDQIPPTNCATGAYIVFGEQQDACFCALRCSDFDPPKQVGESCDANGQTTCTYVENMSGTSSGNWCLTDAWIALDLDCSQ